MNLHTIRLRIWRFLKSGYYYIINIRTYRFCAIWLFHSLGRLSANLKQ